MAQCQASLGFRKALHRLLGQGDLNVHLLADLLVLVKIREKLVLGLDDKACALAVLQNLKDGEHNPTQAKIERDA